MGSTTTPRTGLLRLLDEPAGTTPVPATARYDATSGPTGVPTSSGHAGAWTPRGGASSVVVAPATVVADRLDHDPSVGIPVIGAPTSFRSCGTTVPGSARLPAP